jgi:hypothetical protein
MLAVIIVTIFIFFSCLGLGIWIYDSLKIQTHILLVLITGLVAVTFISQAISFFHPLNDTASFALIVTMLLVYGHKRKTIHLTLQGAIYKNIVAGFLALPFLIIGFFIAQEPPLHYDTALYHFQFIIWNHSYPVIPGLANIHGRFGFNNSIFTAHTIFTFVDLFKQPIFALNYFLFSIGVLGFIKTIYSKFVKDDRSITLLNLGNIVFFGGFLALTTDVSSPAPDYAANGVLMLLGLVFMNHPPRRNFDWVPYVLISFYLVTVKLSMLPILFLAMVGFYYLLRTHTRLFYITSFIAFSVVAIWIVRNYIISGWLIYPFPHVNIQSPDWQVPIETVQFEADAITGWARIPGMDIRVSSKLPFLSWFPIWWNHANYGKIYFTLCLILSFLSLVFLIKRMIIQQNTHKTLAITVVLGFMFWFIKAPDFRFSLGFLFLIMVLPFYYVRTQKINVLKSYHTSVLFVFIVSLIFVLAAKFHTVIIDNALPKLISGRYKTPKTMEYIGRPQMDSFYINDQVFYFPYKSDSTLDFRCYDHCLPCIPTKDTLIGFRGDGLEDGFYRKGIK